MTRAPQPDESEDTPDIARVHANLTEPFMVMIRELRAGEGIKLVFWYIAQVEEKAVVGDICGELAFRPQFLNYKEALQRLTFQEDREILQAAIVIVENSSP